MANVGTAARESLSGLTKRLRDLPRRDWVVASALVASLTLFYVAIFLFRSHSIWTLLTIPAAFLYGLSYLVRRSTDRMRKNIRRLEAESAHLQAEIDQLEAKRQARAR